MSYASTDSASIINAVGALTYYEDREEWNSWTKQSITDVTAMFITHHLLKISPGLSPSLSRPAQAHSTLYNCYDQSCSRLGEIVEDAPQKGKDILQDSARASAEKDFKDWLYNNVEDAKSAITKTKRESSYPQWIDWAINQAWVDHSYRLNGLFNDEMIDNLSLILEVPSNDMKTLWKKTKDLQQIKRWSQGQNLDSDFELARDAYVASTILRGRFHDFISSQNNEQIMPHPIRQHILVPLPVSIEYTTPKPLEYLVNIIAHSAIEEQKPKDRVSRWTDNILKTRRACLCGKIEQIFDQYPELDESALEIAIDTAKKLQLRLYSQSTEECLKWAITLGSPLIGFISLSPWIALGGIGLSILEMKKPVSRSVLETLTLTKRNLRELATSPAGRIVRIGGDIKR